MQIMQKIHFETLFIELDAACRKPRIIHKNVLEAACNPK